MRLTKRNTVFNTVETPRPLRSIFELSYEKKMTMDMGQLIPIMCDEMVPGDHFKIGASYTIRFQPIVAPIMHEVNATVHYFFVPYRLLWNEALGDESSFEEFITGGDDGNASPTVPTWIASGHNAIGTLWDYMGLPTGVNPADNLPVDFPRRAYYKVWNEFYRDENLQTELDITDQNNYVILNRAWSKDYFTSALLWQQKGTAPAIPLAGSTSAVFAGDVDIYNVQSSIDPAQYQVGGVNPGNYEYGNNDNAINTMQPAVAQKTRYTGASRKSLDDNVVDLTGASGPSVAEVRLGFQVQKFLERNARGGNRYVEFLRNNHGVNPRDERLQRSEFIGGTKSKVLFSEVLQTSESNTTPQGNMAGHGIGVNSQYCGSYYAKEFGLILGILSICPVPAYQQGINRQWLRKTQIDMFNPLFSHLSERAIENVEIYAQATGQTPSNLDMFGFQGMYNEMRYKPNLICGLMRTDYYYWHLGRIFGSLPGLNEDFIKCVPDKRIFAATTEPGLIVNFANHITAVRPIPINPVPGYVDHF